MESGARCEEKSRARDKLHDADDAFSDPLQDKKKRRGFNKYYVEDRQCRNCGLFGHLEFHPFCPTNVTTASCTKEYPKEPRRRHHGQKKKEPKWVYLADEKNNFLVRSGFELYSRA